MTQQINNNHEEARKGLDEQKMLFVRFENDFVAHKEKMQKLAEGSDDGEGGGGGKKISAQQRLFNKSIGERMDNVDREVERLGRIDFRLNKELVQKPLTFMNKVKEELMKEQSAIQKIINSNNEKYISKMVNLEHHVNKVLTDTETLLF